MTEPGRPDRAPSGRRKRRGERSMVPDADFGSYYGRSVVKAAPWKSDVPAYMFLGGLAAGSSLLAVGADLTRRVSLRRSARIAALTAISASAVALIHDLGRPSRFHHMLRVAKVTSPMSVGSWILVGYGPMAGLAGAAEISAALRLERRLRPPLRGLAAALRFTARPAGLVAAALAPALASYTAVLLSDTATPTWHEGRAEMPYVFAGSSAAAAGGLAMVAAPPADTGPARRMAIGGGLLELAAGEAMARSAGLAAEPLRQGRSGRLMTAAKVLTGAGLIGAVAGRSHRAIAVLSGAALFAGSAVTRFGIVDAGKASALDPKYTVVPQRERVDASTVRG